MTYTVNTSTAIAIREAVNSLTTELVRADIDPTCVTVWATGGPVSFMVHVDSSREFHAARGLFSATQPKTGSGDGGQYQVCDGQVGWTGPKVTLFGPVELPADCDSADPEAVSA